MDQGEGSDGPMNEPQGSGRADGGMRVALLGFGLIGGSIARAVSRVSTGTPGTAPGRAAIGRLTAWSPTGRGPVEALTLGLIDHAAADPAEALGDADLIVLAAPPLECLRLLDGLGGPWRSRLASEATITDVASTKARIVERAEGLGLPFVGGHPMAGRESSGFAAASAALFDGRPWVVVPASTADERDVARVERLATACGARPVRLTAAEHDAAVAGISHLPLVLAAALVEAVAGRTDGGPPSGWPLARDLAAGGWQGMTRLARGDPAMGAGILATNDRPVVERLRDLRRVIDAWLTDLGAPDGPDADALERRLAAVRARLVAAERPEGGPDGT